MSSTAKKYTLPSQAPHTANTYLLDAIEDIDEKLGDGYAKAHPEVLAAYLNAAGSDNAALVRRFDELNEILRKLYKCIDEYAVRYD